MQDLILATQWIHVLLALKAPDDQEFSARMEHLLAELGRSKIAYLHEDELRSLGGSCAIPLAKYIAAERPAEEKRQQVEAARILADLAPSWAIPDLIQLLSNPNGEVRGHVARALQRLTGQTQGRPAEEWRTAAWAQSAPTQRFWEQWWDQNKERYPARPGR